MYLFQFHMVRLKAAEELAPAYGETFQFHMVRLKVCTML